MWREVNDQYDGLPCYIGEVNVYELSPEKTVDKLVELKYGFNKDTDSTKHTPINSKVFIPIEGPCYFLHIEGGQIFIELLCARVEIKKP